MPIGRHIWATLRWNRPVRSIHFPQPVLTIPRRRYQSNETGTSIESAAVDTVTSSTSAPPSGSDTVNSKAQSSSQDANPPKKPKKRKGPRKPKSGVPTEDKTAHGDKSTKKNGGEPQKDSASRSRTTTTDPRTRLPIFRSSPIPMGSYTDWLKSFIEESGVVPTLEHWRLLSKKSNVYRFPLTRKEFDDIISGVDITGVPNWSTRGLNQRRKTEAYMREIGAIDKKPYILTIIGDERKNYPPNPNAASNYYTEDDISYEALCEALLRQSPGAVVSMLQIPQLRKFKIQYFHGVIKAGIEDGGLGTNDDGTLFVANAAYGRKIAAGGFGKTWIRCYRVKKETREPQFIPHLAQKLIEHHERQLSRLQALGSEIVEGSEIDFQLLTMERESAMGAEYTSDVLEESPVLPEQPQAFEEPLKSSASLAVNEIAPPNDNNEKPIIESSDAINNKDSILGIPRMPQPSLEHPIEADITHDNNEGGFKDESQLVLAAARDLSELSILPAATDPKLTQPVTTHFRNGEMEEIQNVREIEVSQEVDRSQESQEAQTAQEPRETSPEPDATQSARETIKSQETQETLQIWEAQAFSTKEQVETAPLDTKYQATFDLPETSTEEREKADPLSLAQERGLSADIEALPTSLNEQKQDTPSTHPKPPKLVDDGYEYLRQIMSTKEQEPNAKVAGHEESEGVHVEEIIPRRSRRQF
ncbi:hypothetical protein TWF694_007169 [Orbilia ellipsospora]|uniref:Uncharacterized protein n=1 Tax=Orbilia ellipsospora TaxID=2528407 RepID=A0AAV9XGY7_9PEZI